MAHSSPCPDFTWKGVDLPEDLTFSVMIDSELGELELIQAMVGNLAGSQRVGGYVRYEKNVLKLEKNSLYDAQKAQERNNESWMYYRYSLSVFPEGEVTLVLQRKVASEIVSALGKEGASAELVA
jgi:hypothetical protein